jgi:hypothetical protein
MSVSAVLRLVGAAADLLSLLLVPPLLSPLLPIVAVLRVLILYWLQGCLLLLSLLRPILFLASTMKRSGMPRPLKSAMTGPTLIMFWINLGGRWLKSQERVLSQFRDVSVPPSSTVLAKCWRQRMGRWLLECAPPGSVIITQVDLIL